MHVEPVRRCGRNRELHGVPDRSRFISRNDVPPEVRGAIVRKADPVGLGPGQGFGRNRPSAPPDQYRCREGGGHWPASPFPLAPISPSPAGCARPGEHASGQPDRRPAAGSLGAPRPVAWAACLSRVAWPAEALPSGCPGHPLRRRGDGRTGRTTRVAGNPVPAGRPVSIKIYAKTRDNRRRPCRCAGVTTGSPVWRGDQGRGIGGEERPSRHRRPRRRAGPLDGASVDA